MNWAQFWAMGGYAVYVWTSYALALIVLVLNVWLPIRQRRLWLRAEKLRLQRLETRQ